MRWARPPPFLSHPLLLSCHIVGTRVCRVATKFVSSAHALHGAAHRRPNYAFVTCVAVVFRTKPRITSWISRSGHRIGDRCRMRTRLWMEDAHHDGFGPAE